MTRQPRSPDEMRQMSLEELRAVLDRRDPPPGWRQREWFNERVHACGEVWRRRLEQNEPLTSDELRELLYYAELDTALGTIGDAARLGLLTTAQCETVLAEEGLDQYPKTKWLRHELQLRQDVLALRPETRPEARRSLLDRLLHQSRDWAVREALDCLSEDELQYCESVLSDPGVLTRWGRGQVRDAIRSARKRRQKR